MSKRFTQLWPIACLILLGLIFRPALAQEGITVLENQARLDFPKTIEFRATIESDADIESAVLHYGTLGRGCQSAGGRQVLQVEPGATTNLSWEWDLTRSGILPPGADVWWHWEIDTEQDSIISDRQFLRIQDDRFRFQRVSGDGITLWWIEGDSEFGDYLLQEAKTSMVRLERQMDLGLDEEITITVYPTVGDLQEALVFTTEWTAGVASPRHNSIVLAIEPTEFQWAARVIPHELTHLVVGALTFNCSGISVPAWLNEGLAEYSEGLIGADSEAVVLSALEDGRLSTLRSLAHGFSAYGNVATLAYDQSAQIVKYLVDHYGSVKLIELLRTMQGGEIIDNALEIVYGLDTDGLDSEWRVAQGADPLPELTPTSPPTAVPTLAPFTLDIPPTAEPTTTTAVTKEATATPLAVLLPTPASIAESPAIPEEVDAESEESGSSTVDSQAEPPKEANSVLEPQSVTDSEDVSKVDPESGSANVAFLMAIVAGIVLLIIVLVVVRIMFRRKVTEESD